MLNGEAESIDVNVSFIQIASQQKQNRIFGARKTFIKFNPCT